MKFHDCKTTHPKTDADGVSNYVLLYPENRLLPKIAMYVEVSYIEILSPRKRLETNWIDTSGNPLFYITPYMWAEIEYPNQEGGGR